MEEVDDCGVGIGGGLEEPVEELEEKVLSLCSLARTGRGEWSTGDCGPISTSVGTGGECGDGERELEAPPPSLSASASTSEVSSPEISSSGSEADAPSSNDKRLSLVDVGSRAGESARVDRGEAMPV